MTILASPCAICTRPATYVLGDSTRCYDHRNTARVAGGSNASLPCGQHRQDGALTPRRPAGDIGRPQPFAPGE